MVVRRNSPFYQLALEEKALRLISLSFRTFLFF